MSKSQQINKKICELFVFFFFFIYFANEFKNTRKNLIKFLSVCKEINCTSFILFIVNYFILREKRSKIKKEIVEKRKNKLHDRFYAKAAFVI